MSDQLASDAIPCTVVPLDGTAFFVCDTFVPASSSAGVCVGNIQLGYVATMCCDTVVVILCPANSGGLCRLLCRLLWCCIGIHYDNALGFVIFGLFHKLMIVVPTSWESG